MRLPTLLVAICLLTVAGVGQTQEPKPLPVPAIPDAIPVQRIDPPQPPVPPTKPADLTVDQMLDALEALRVQKAELEKKEREMVAALGKKVETQTARMKKLGIANDKPIANEFEPKGVPPAIPPAIIR